MNDMKRASCDEVPKALWKRQRHDDKPARVNFSSMVEISRALGAIPGEFGEGLRQKIWKKGSMVISCWNVLTLSKRQQKMSPL
jgi:hypothetical protein